jgi:Phage tail lysozyme
MQSSPQPLQGSAQSLEQESDISRQMPPAPALDAATLSQLVDDQNPVAINIGGRTPAVLEKVPDGFQIRTATLVAHLDSHGACTGFSDASGRQYSQRYILGDQLINRINQLGIATENVPAESFASANSILPRADGETERSPATTPDSPGSQPDTDPAQSPEESEPKGSSFHLDLNRKTPHLNRKGVSETRLNHFIDLVEKVADQYGVELNKAHIAALTGTCLQENALSTSGNGICQWYDGRARNLASFTRQYQQSHDGASKLEAQIAFVFHEMGIGTSDIRGAGRGSEKAAGRTFESATTLDAAMRGMAQYERFDHRKAGNRGSFAREIYANTSQE